MLAAQRVERKTVVRGEGTRAMFIPLDLNSKEEHSSDLRSEADRELNIDSMLP